MKTELITVTPKMAAAMLELNYGNRNMRPHNLKYWEAVLNSGNYQPTHQGLAVQGNCKDYIRLLDGQHRLQAVVNTGISALFNITWDCPPDYVFANTDGGVGRSNQDRIQLPKKELEVATFLCRALSQARLLNDDMTKMHSAFSFNFKSFKTGKKGLSTTAIRAAFCVWGNQSDVGSLFHDFISGNFHDLPSSLCALYKKCMTGHFSGYKGNLELFCITMKALENQDFKRLLPPEDLKEQSRQYINKYINK